MSCVLPPMLIHFAIYCVVPPMLIHFAIYCVVPPMLIHYALFMWSPLCLFNIQLGGGPLIIPYTGLVYYTINDN